MALTNEQRTELMGNERVPKIIMRLALPAMISMLVLAIYNMADTYFVSLSREGYRATAAVSVYMPILLLTQAVSIWFAAGGAAYLARLLGENDKQGASQVATTTILLSFFTGVGVAVLGLAISKPMLFAMGASDTTIGLAMDYAVIMLIAAPIQLTNMSFNNLLRAEGNAVRSMTGMVAGAVLNMVLDPIFILNFDMGVRGAAIATAISQCVSFVILSSSYFCKRTVAPFVLKKFRFQKEVVRYIVRIGGSTFTIQFLTAVAIGIINICAKQYGDGAIAALGIVNRLQYLGFAVVFGFSQGFQPVAGYNFGAERFDRLRTALRFGIIASILIGGGVTLLCFSAAPLLVGLFSAETSVLQIGIPALRWFTCTFALTAFSIVMLMTYQALGRARGALILSVCRQGVCLIPAVLVLSGVLGLQGILISPLVADLTSGVVAVVLALRIFRFVKRREAQSLEKQEVAYNA